MKNTIIKFSILFFMLTACSPVALGVGQASHGFKETTSFVSSEISIPKYGTCKVRELEYIHTGRTINATLITHKSMDHEIKTKISNGKVFILIENSINGHQWSVFYVPICQFGYIDKNQIEIDS